MLLLKDLVILSIFLHYLSPYTYAQLKIGDTVKLNDTLKTSTLGYVELTGNDGSIIQVEGGAIINLKENDEKEEIHYQNTDGSVTLKPKKEINLKIDDKNVDITENTTISLNHDTANKYNLIVEQGYITIDGVKYDKSFFKFDKSSNSISEILSASQRQEIAKKFDIIFSKNNEVNTYTIDDFDNDGRSFNVETNNDITDPKKYDLSSNPNPHLSASNIYAYTKIYTLFNEHILNNAREIKYTYVIDGVEQNITSKPQILVVTPAMIGKKIFARIKYVSNITNKVVNNDSTQKTVLDPIGSQSLNYKAGNTVNLLKLVKTKYDPTIYDVNIYLKQNSSSTKEYITNDNLYLSAKYINKPNATWWIEATNKSNNVVNNIKMGDFIVNPPTVPVNPNGYKIGKVFYSRSIINHVDDVVVQYITVFNTTGGTINDVTRFTGLRHQVRVVSTSPCFGTFDSGYYDNVKNIPQLKGKINASYETSCSKTVVDNKAKLKDVTVYNRYVDNDGNVIISEYTPL